MKKKIYLCLLILSILIIPWNTFAAGGYSVSKSSVSLTKGGSTTVTISVTNAAGRIDISSSNSAVATVSTGSIFVDAYQETRTYLFTISTKAAGSAVITVTPRDMATYDKEVISGSRQIQVAVNEPASPNPSTPNTPTPSVPKPSGPADTRSTNTALKSLTVNGKTLTNSNNVYTLEVSNYIEKIDLAAVVADNKSKLTGTGSKNLKVGENNFNVVVTAERGNTATYIINVIRKEFNTLSDFGELIKLKKDFEVIISEKDNLTKSQLDSVIDSKIKLILTKVSDDKKVLYSFIIDGSKTKSVDIFNPNVTTIIENNEKMEEALNYANGIYFDFSKCNNIPKGIILKYYVGDKYKDNDKVNLYAYNSDKVTQLKEGILVSDGFIEFEVDDAISYFITKAKVMNVEVKKDGFDWWMISSFVLAGIVVILVGLISFDKINMVRRYKKTSTDNVVSRLNNDNDNQDGEIL